METCIFCKIASYEEPSEILFENDSFLVFKDLHPSAPIHYLIIPKSHVQDISFASDAIWLGIKGVVSEVAKKLGVVDFRLATNAGSTAFVPHFHMHFLSGIMKERSV